MAVVNTYSFLDFSCSISGPGGSFSLGNVRSGIDKGGITIMMTEDKDVIDVGADGTAMHSLRASKQGVIIVRLQKTSPVNALLSKMMNYQQTSAANWGQNVITGANPTRGDTFVARECAFRKMPDNLNAVEGGMLEWQFMAGYVDQILGDGSPVAAV
jgi:hypothetical protein